MIPTLTPETSLGRIRRKKTSLRIHSELNFGFKKTIGHFLNLPLPLKRKERELRKIVR